MDTFSISVLGPFALLQNGVAVDTGGWQPRALTLLKMVATGLGARRSRDELVELLWPDATPEAGASNLRYTLHLLRRALGSGEPSPILFQQGWIILNPAYTWEIDLARFEQLVGEGSGTDDPTLLEAAAELYRGEPLLEDRYDDWAVPIRDRVRRLWRELCLALVDVRRHDGRPEEAIRWYQRALEDDPLDEEVVQRLLTALSDSGRHTEAVRLYRQFEQRLCADLDLEPMPETAAIIGNMSAQRAEARITARQPAPRSDVRAARVVPSYPLPASGRMAGRDTPLDEVLNALPEADSSGTSGAGCACLVLLAADAGMGKTRLLAEIARRAREREILILAGGCYEEEGRLPWGPIHDALHDYVRAQPDGLLRAQMSDLLPELAQLVPELRARITGLPEQVPNDPDAQRLRLFSTVAQVLERLSRDCPLLLLLDDLHWADDVTLQALHFLVRQPGLQRVLIAGAYRSDEVATGTLLHRLARRAESEGQIRAIALQPLTERDTAVVLEERLEGTCDPNLVNALHQRAAGNPFFTLQMLQLLEQEGRVCAKHGIWALAPGTHVDLPPAVRDTVARRLRLVAPEVRAILNVAAVLGREFPYAPLETVSSQQEDSLFSALDAAQDAQLLQETREGYAFVHPLLWEVIYHRVPDQRRRRLHDRAGLALERIYGQAVERAAELAWHFVEGGNLERALRYSLLAGDNAERVGAHAEAEGHYRTAIELARRLDDSVTMARSLEKVGVVLQALSKLDEAVMALDEAARVYQASGDLGAEARAMAQLGLATYFQRAQYYATSSGEDVLDRMKELIKRLESRDGDTSSRELALLYASLPRLLGVAHRFAEEVETAERAVELGHAVGDGSIVAAGHLRRGTGYMMLQRDDEALRALDAAASEAERSGDLLALAAAANFAAEICLSRGDVATAAEWAERAFRAAERRGGLEQLAGIARVAETASRIAGEWDRASRYSERYLALQRSLRGMITDSGPWARLGELAVYQGQWDSAEEYFEQAIAIARTHDDILRIRQIAALRAQRDLLENRPDKAIERLRPFLDAPLPDPGARVWPAQYALTVPWVWAELGDHGRAEELAAAALRAATSRREAPVLADALGIQGTVFARQRRWEEAEGVLRKAISLTQAMPYPFAEARISHELGCLVAEQGEVKHSSALLERALTIFQQVGARPYFERTQHALRALPAAR